MYLPAPPADEETSLYLENNRRLYYGLGFFSSSLLIAGMFFFAISSVWLFAWLIFVSIFLLYLGLNFFVGLRGDKYRTLLKSPVSNDQLNAKPTIDVYLPICGEPKEVIHNTWVAVKKMVDKYGPKAVVYVLDDSKKIETFPNPKDFGFKYIRREDVGVNKKSGNLRNAFAQTTGEFFLILDADFAPHPNMLNKLYLAFLEDPGLACLQTPQFFRPLGTMIQRGASQIQELFYRLIQVNRDTFGAAVCVGTCAMYRRAPLIPNGGTYLIDYSEDVHTGLYLLDQGFKVRYVPEILSCGVCPETVSQFLAQQYRWAMGSISLCLNPWFWKAKTTTMQRLCFVSGFAYYLATGLSVVISYVPTIIVLNFFPEKVHIWNYLYCLPSFLFSTLFMSYWTKSGYGVSAHICRELQSWAHFKAMVDKFKGKIVPWQATGQITSTPIYNMITKWFMISSLSTTILILAGIVSFLRSDIAIWHITPVILLLGFRKYIEAKTFWQIVVRG